MACSATLLHSLVIFHTSGLAAVGAGMVLRARRSIAYVSFCAGMVFCVPGGR